MSSTRLRLSIQASQHDNPDRYALATLTVSRPGTSLRDLQFLQSAYYAGVLENVPLHSVLITAVTNRPRDKVKAAGSSIHCPFFSSRERRRGCGCATRHRGAGNGFHFLRPTSLGRAEPGFVERLRSSVSAELSTSVAGAAPLSRLSVAAAAREGAKLATMRRTRPPSWPLT